MSAARPIIRFAGRKIAVDLPHLAFVSGIGAWSAWFCADAWHSNSGVENLILIVPVSAAAVILYLFIAAGCFRIADDAEGQRNSPREPLAIGIGLKIAGSMALLAAFVVTGPWIGFDVASFLYILATMAFLGERRILVLLLVPLVFCVAAIYCFNDLLQTPLPLFFAPGNAS
jgi:putative tricarboxylic transport membrane protein